MTGVVQVVSCKRRLLMRFHDGCEKDLTSNKLTVFVLDRSTITKEAKVPTISAISDETIYLEKE